MKHLLNNSNWFQEKKTFPLWKVFGIFLSGSVAYEILLRFWSDIVPLLYTSGGLFHILFGEEFLTMALEICLFLLFIRFTFGFREKEKNNRQWYE